MDIYKYDRQSDASLYHGGGTTEKVILYDVTLAMSLRLLFPHSHTPITSENSKPDFACEQKKKDSSGATANLRAPGQTVTGSDDAAG